MFVPSGSRLTFVADYGAWSFATQTVNDVVAAAQAEIKNSYDLIVEHVSDNIGVAGLGSGSITLSLLTLMDRGGSSDGIEDIRGNVASALANAGSAPSASRITSYKLASSAATQQTGAPSASASASDSSSTSISSWWSDAVSKLEGAGIGFSLGVLAVVGFGVYLVFTEK